MGILEFEALSMRWLLYIFLFISNSLFAETANNKDSTSIDEGDVLVVLKDTSVALINPKLKFNYSLLFPEAESIVFDTSYTSQGNEIHDIIPHYPDSIIKKRLSSFKNKIPPVYHDKVLQWIKIYTQRNRFKARRILGKKAYYFPFIEHHLRNAGIPEELKYIAVIESALDPYALSPSGAMGLWQFIRSTAVKHMGMHIDPIRDERRDHFNSTKNAIKYFKELYGIFDNWLLAIAAYNGGPGTVKRAMRKYGKKDFFSLMPYLPAETQNYVPAFMAVMYLDKYAKLHYLSPTIPEQYHSFLHPNKLERVKLRGPLSFEDLAKAIGVSMEKIVFLNPDYNIPFIPKGQTLELVLPKGKGLIAKAQNNILRNNNLNNTSNHYSIYTVKSGDNLQKIASKNACSIRDLKSWNGLQSTLIYPGQKLWFFNHTFYQSAYYKKYQSDNKGKHIEKDGYIYYTIKGGDTLYKIAKQFNLPSIESIKEENKIGDVRSLVPGAVLKLQKRNG